MPQITIPTKVTGNTITATEINSIVTAHNTNDTKLAGVAANATANDTDANLKARANHTGTQSADTIIDGATNKVFTAANQTKLAGISTGATVNDTDINLKARSNHTGTQSADTITDGTTNKVLTAAEKTKLTGIATGATANSADSVLFARANHTGTQSADTIIDGTTNKVLTTAEKTKLTGIATGATANSTDATLLARANHTGSQAQSTITNLVTDLAAKQASLVAGSNIKTFGGVSPLGSGDIDVAIKVGGVIPESDLPPVDIMPALSNQFEEIAGKATIKASVLSSGGGSFDIFSFLQNNRLQKSTFTCSSTAINHFGYATLVAVGSTAVSLGTSDYRSRLHRLSTNSTAAAGTMGSLTQANHIGSLNGGFKYSHRFSIDDDALVTGAIMFVGMTGATSAHVATVEPSANVNIVGVGADSTDTNLQIMHNDASGVATKIDLGASFPASTGSGLIYRVEISAPVTGTEFTVKLTSYNDTTGAQVSTDTRVLTTNIPLATQRLAWQGNRGNLAQALMTKLVHYEVMVLTGDSI